MQQHGKRARKNAQKKKYKAPTPLMMLMMMADEQGPP